MLKLLKAIIPGGALTLIVAGLVGSNGSTGGVLQITHMNIQGHEVYGSWNLFIAATGLAWLLFMMMD